MLRLWIGNKEFDNDTGEPDFYFDEEMDAECIDTDFGRRVVKECSDIESVINYATLKLPNGELVSPRELASGAKNLLIMMFSEEDVVCDLRWCGDNCNKFIAEVANTKDITVKTTRWYMPYLRGETFDEGILILNTNTVVRSVEEYRDHIIATGLVNEM